MEVVEVNVLSLRRTPDTHFEYVASGYEGWGGGSLSHLNIQ